MTDKDIRELNSILIPIAGIEPESIVDGPGYRYVIFTQGCPHNCKGCHNPQTHTMKTNNYVSAYSIIKDIETNKIIEGVTFSGGEPFLHVNKLLPIAKRAKELYLGTMAYTGYTFEELIKSPQNVEFLKYIDVLADGKFEIDKKSLKLLYVGSSNQRLINVHKSLLEGKVVLWKSDEDDYI